MFLEDLVFCIKWAGWKVTKINAHLTFEQKRFKQKFILMNQKSWQESKNSVEKDFYKLMNNSNFGYDCRNNLDNCKFVPIFDEYRESTFISRYYNLFDSKVKQFITSDLRILIILMKYLIDVMVLKKNLKLMTSKFWS